MKIKVISLIGINPIPAGSFAVVCAEIEPDNIDAIDSNGCIRKRYWIGCKIYKRFSNAKKAKEKLSNQGWNDFYVQSRILNLN